MMARDKNAEERIESIAYSYGAKRSGDIASEVYDDEVAPLIEHLENLLLAHAGVPIDAVKFGYQVEEAREAVRNAKRAPKPRVALLKDAGFAHGDYAGGCRKCHAQFEGDKRAYICEECAKKRLREVLPDADYTEADLDYVETSTDGVSKWVLNDGRRVPVPEGWVNDIPGRGGVTATIISTDGRTEIKR